MGPGGNNRLSGGGIRTPGTDAASRMETHGKWMGHRRRSASVQWDLGIQSSLEAHHQSREYHLSQSGGGGANVFLDCLSFLLQFTYTCNTFRIHDQLENKHFGKDENILSDRKLGLYLV